MPLEPEVKQELLREIDPLRRMEAVAMLIEKNN
jgi:hypothetical protein